MPSIHTHAKHQRGEDPSRQAKEAIKEATKQIEQIAFVVLFRIGGGVARQRSAIHGEDGIQPRVEAMLFHLTSNDADQTV